MTIVVLFVVLALRLVNNSWADVWTAPDRIYRFIAPVEQWAKKHGRSENFAWFFAVLLPVLLWLVLRGTLPNLLGWFVDGLLLLWLLGAVSEFRYVDNLLLRAEINDEVAFATKAQDYFAIQGDTTDEGYVDTLVRHAIVKNAEGVFATLFWLFVLGAGGALFYALNFTLAQRYSGQGIARIIHNAMCWLPHRLFVIAVACVGSFRGATEPSAPYWWSFSDDKALLNALVPEGLDLLHKDKGGTMLEEAQIKLSALLNILNKSFALWLIFGVLWFALLR